ncbi:hypothetical protein BJV74DRAFT_45766 [Russula compacta]|nr:hypothetical protein BJV74DRAFT_45766 [Russula compacta]
MVFCRSYGLALVYVIARVCGVCAHPDSSASCSSFGPPLPFLPATFDLRWPSCNYRQIHDTNHARCRLCPSPRFRPVCF